MSVMTWAHGRADAILLWDIGLLKVYCVIFGMIAGAFFAPFVLANVWWFVGAVAVLGGRGAYGWFAA